MVLYTHPIQNSYNIHKIRHGKIYMLAMPVSLILFLWKQCFSFMSKELGTTYTFFDRYSDFLGRHSKWYFFWGFKNP